MHIDQFNDPIQKCRFCFMCRHLSGVGNVTFTEADTPRVRAGLVYGLQARPEGWRDPDFIDTVYRSDLSAACRRNCVNHYDENGLMLAARADIVEQGLAPAYVQALARKYRKASAWKVQGRGKALYLADRYSAAAGADKAFAKLMAARKLAFRTISGGCLGKSLKILGYLDDAKAQAEAFAAFVKPLKASVLVVSSPAAYDALTKDYPGWGVKLGVPVKHTSEFLLEQGFAWKRPAGEVYYLESDFLRNYDESPYPAKLLEALRAKCLPFGTNDEESYSCGEGAMLLPEFNAELVKDLALYIEERADHPKTDRIVTASPYTKVQLAKYTKLQVSTLEELALAAL